MRAIAKSLLVGVLCLVAVAGGRSAEPGAAKPAASPKAAEGLTDAELDEMLKGMGHEYTSAAGRDDKEPRWFRLTVSRAELGGKFHVHLRIGSKGTRLWGHVALADLTPRDLENASALRKLLELNDAIGPNAFRINERKELYLSRCSETRGLTPARLREHIEGLIDGCVKTKADWDTSKWTTGTVKK